MPVIAQTTGHKSMTVLRRYIQEGNLLNEYAPSGRLVVCLRCRNAQLSFGPSRQDGIEPLPFGSRQQPHRPVAPDSRDRDEVPMVVVRDEDVLG